MRYLIALSAVVSALAVSATAGAGGWATVGFEPLPDGTAAGGTWNPHITVKQHGRVLLGGLQPVVTIQDVDSGASHSFPAAPTSEVGVYEADVVFPAAGEWQVTIDSGFGDSRVTYGPTTIGPTAGNPGAEPFPVVGVAAALGLLALAVAVLIGARRLRRLTPASH